MAIAFACPHCKSRYQVDVRLAGRKARCKTCQGQMMVPLRSTVEAPVRETVGAASAPASSPERMFPTNIGLAPLDDDDVKPSARLTQKEKERKKSYNPALDAPSNAALPQLVPTNIALPNLAKNKGGKPPNMVVAAWRSLIGGQIKILRTISNFAYLITIPFILAFLIGVLLRKEALAYPAAAVIVILNIVRFALNGLTLVSIPFKSGPGQGLMFLIPPFTFIYLLQHWKKMKKAILSFLGPAVPIPWLHTGGKDDKIEAIREQVQSAESRLGVDQSKVDDLGTRAAQGIGQIKQAVEAEKQLLNDRP
jgi:predicted Zn finger-like uncharacterized protein